MWSLMLERFRARRSWFFVSILTFGTIAVASVVHANGVSARSLVLGIYVLGLVLFGSVLGAALYSYFAARLGSRH